MSPQDDLGVVDPAGLDYWHDIHGTLAPLRERWPVVRSTAGDFEVLRWEDGDRLLRDPRTRQALQGMLAHQGITSGPLYDWWQLLMNNRDGEPHARLRSLVGRAFTPRQVERVRPRIREVANGILDELAGRGDDGVVDVVPTFCHELPLVILCEMLGVPVSDVSIVERWTTTVALAFSAVIPDELRAQIETAITEFDEYADDLVARRRSDPGDDLLSALVHAEEEGERLSLPELRALVINRLFAGHDTTKSLLSIGLWLLATHPDEYARLRGDRSLVTSAVEEIARYETPISGIPRLTTEDVEVAGVTMPAGSYVTVSVPSANRDPRRFPDADRFDVGRRDNRHLTFGFGVHHCVGSAVARAEVQEALAVVVDRWAALETTIDEPAWVPYAAARRFEALPLSVAQLARSGSM